MAAQIDLSKFDDVFLGILQHLGRIEPFLEAIFYFLARRTDFFKLMHNRDDKLGFPPGVAEQMLLRIFKKYQKVVLGNDAKQSKSEKESIRKKPKEKASTKSSETGSVKIPEPIKTVEVETSVAVQPDSSSEISSVSSGDSVECKIKQAETPTKPESESKSKKEVFSQDPDSFNGAVTEKYSWAQTHSDVDVKVPVPNFIKKGKDIDVEIKPDKLRVSLKNDPPTDSGLPSKIIVEGKFMQHIRHDESFWSLVPGECLQIHIEKTKEIFWTALLEGEKEIDKTKLDTTRDISEFDEQTQADFNKVMYDHHQKLQGKPTSEEQKTHDLLKQAWDAEGSPFKGTPFDPSSVNISGGMV